MEPWGASPTARGLVGDVQCGTAAQQAAAGTCSTGEGTAQLALRRGRGPCPGQAGAQKGVHTTGKPEACCSLQGRGFCKSWVLVKAHGWHKLLYLQDAIAPSPTRGMPANSAGSPAAVGYCPEFSTQQPESMERMIKVWPSVCWGGEEAGGGGQHPGDQGCRKGREHPYLWGSSQGAGGTVLQRDLRSSQDQTCPHGSPPRGCAIAPSALWLGARLQKNKKD